MNLKNKLASILLFGVFLLSTSASALTIDQFVSICESAGVECSEHPFLQAYVGGALDLVAMLDEETDYLDRIYCTPPKDLFDVPTIIQFMEQQKAAYAGRNAMLVLILYLEQHSGCR